MGVFAIQSFLKTAHDEFELKEGEWFRSTTFLMGLDYILAAHPKAISDVDLRVYNMNDNMIYLKDLFDKLYHSEPQPRETVKLGDLSAFKETRSGPEELGHGEQVDKDSPDDPKLKADTQGVEPNSDSSDCRNEDIPEEGEKPKEGDLGAQKELIQSPKESPDWPTNTSPERASPVPRKMTFSCGDSDSSSGHDYETVAEYKAHLKTREIDRPLLLCLNTMLGLSQIDPNNERFLKRLYDLPSFVGMLGGREYKAFYFFGYDENYFYYLDPHYVKSAHDERFTHEEYVKYYFEKTIFKMKYKSIAPSLSLCFLIQSATGGHTTRLILRFTGNFGVVL